MDADSPAAAVVAPSVPRGVVPDGPVDLAEVIERFPTLRQSLLSNYDDCALSALFKMRYEKGWSTHPQARGTIFHRVAAECLRTMKANDSNGIPVGVALSILEEVLYQRDVDPRDIIRLPMRELPELEMAVRKFAKDNQFTIRSVVDIERRLSAVLTYPGEGGEEVQRTLTGQLDALIAAPDGEAIVIDWKDTWALPPERDKDAEKPGVSYHGYFQQMMYAFLVLENYPAVQAVTLREFYARKKQKREARVHRRDLPTVRRRLSYIVANFDAAIASGNPPRLRLDDLEAHGSWKPTPGYHCGWCRKAHQCPIDDDYKLAGGVHGMEDASRLAGMRLTAKAIIKRIDEKLMPFADQNGPIPVRHAKGRLVLGHRPIAGGKKARWETYTPTAADRPATPGAEDVPAPDLEAALRDSARRAREARQETAA